MKILVTGGSGVVGLGAIPALRRVGHQVRLLSRHAEEDAPALPAGVEPFTADIADPQPLRAAVAGCDGVLHIAGIVEEKPPEATFEKINIEGTRLLLAAAEAAGAPFFVFISSLGADEGESDYHRSKRAAESLVRAYRGRWLILRPGNVYGPGDETISMLLKMLRTLPAVPVIDDGEQPFQPVWFADLGKAIAHAFADPGLSGQTLELAGPEVTTTDDVLARLSEITGRSPLRLDVPAWLARVGTKALESFGAAGLKFLHSTGLNAPLNSAKLSMLLAENVVREPARNALPGLLHVAPTPLQDGLEQLADWLPEQLPGEGVGALQQATYSAIIDREDLSARELIACVCEHLADVMPIDFAAEPGAPDRAEEGTTHTIAIAGRGHVQVRLEEKTDTRVTFLTVEGHPLAGLLQFEAVDVPEGVRFAVQTFSQPANAVDWLAMRLAGDVVQRQNWRKVVRRVAELCGGATTPPKVEHRSRTLDDEAARALGRWAQHLAQRQQRARANAPESFGATSAAAR